MSLQSSSTTQYQRQLLPQTLNILNRIDDDHEMMREEFAKQRERLSRKKTSLEEAKTTMKKEFFTFQAQLEDLDISSQKYFCERSRLQKLTSTYVSLLMDKSNELKKQCRSCSSGNSSKENIQYGELSDSSCTTSFIIHEEEVS